MGGLIGVWRGGVEHSDHCDLQVWKGGVVCMTSQRFVYGVDRHCRAITGCDAKQQRLPQGDH